MKNEHGFGAALGDKDAWINRAQSAILTLLAEEHALVHPELEARLGDIGVPGPTGKRLYIDPHIVSEAREALLALGVIDEITHATKGGRSVPVLVPADKKGKQTAIARATRRKAMLYARFRTAADSAGPAGELVVRNSLREAGPHLIPMESKFGEVKTVLGHTLKGALDSGAWLQFIPPGGVPSAPIALPIEVKNRRLVLYPMHKEVHQLLSKAAQLQMAQPDYPIVPVLICRKAHSRLFWMAKDLGFRVHATKRQFVHLNKDFTEPKLQELKQELGLVDLVAVTPKKIPRIEEFFTQTITTQAPKSHGRWRAVAPILAAHSEALRIDNIAPHDRQELVRDLRDELEYELKEDLATWALPREEEE